MSYAALVALGSIGLGIVVSAVRVGLRPAITRGAVCLALFASAWLVRLWDAALFVDHPTLQQRAWAFAATSAAVAIALLAFGVPWRTLVGLGGPLFALFCLPLVSVAAGGDLSAAARWGIVGVVAAAWVVLPYWIPGEEKVAPAALWRCAAWLALAAALAENAVRAAKRGLLGEMAVMEDTHGLLLGDAFLVVPVGSLLVFGGLALALSVLGWCSPWRLPRRALFLLAFVAWWTLVVRAVPSLLPVATVLLALGLTVRTTGRMTGAAETFDRFVRRSLPWLAAATVVIGAFWSGRAAWRERVAVAALPKADAGAPNVLLIVLDTVRAESLSLYGRTRPTSPELERIARGGVVFDHAVATSSWTLPTHASLFTGVYPHQHRADARRALDGTYPTLAERFDDCGYRTGGFVANRAYCGRHTGLARGFVRYDETVAAWREMLAGSVPIAALFDGLLPTTRKTAAEVNDEFLGWFDRADGQPCFAFLNYFDAHDPYHVTEARFDQFSSIPWKEREAFLSTGNYSTPEHVQAALDTYEGAISLLDHYIGRLVAELERRGAVENTVIAITSDHGESFGEQGEFGHGWSLTRQQIDVPLVLVYPKRVPAGTRVAPTVNLVDVPATLLELAGQAEKAEMPGRSLARTWNGQPPTASSPVDEAVVAELLSVISFSPQLQATAPVLSLMFGGRQYVLYRGTQREALFDMRADPAGLNNLAGQPGAAEEVVRYRGLLEAWLGAHAGRAAQHDNASQRERPEAAEGG